MLGNYSFMTTGNQGYNPADLPLTIFLNSKVSSSITIQTGVSQWSGTNPVNSYIQTSPTAQPIYASGQSVNFDGINDSLVSQTVYQRGVFTMFFVVRQTTPNAFIFSTATDYIWSGTGSTFEVSRGGVTSGKNIAGGAWLNNNKVKIVMWRFDGTHAGHQVWLNGVQMATTNTGNVGDPGTSLQIASSPVLGSRLGASFLTGSIFSFLERPIALSNLQAKAEFDFLIREFVPLAILNSSGNPVLDVNGDFTY